MDLLTTVRKEGSRGGRGDFKWSDVQSSTHRENYLGHSLMAPVGRWQQGRDLNWYAKGDADEAGGESATEKAERERKEEIKRIKEAEQDALARALGYDVPPRNPNLEALGDRKDVDKILKEAVEDEDADIGKGVGYGKFGNNHGDSNERIQGDDVGIRNGDVEVEAGVEIASGIEGDEKNIKISPGDDRDRRQENARKDDGQEAKIERIIGEATEKEENREEIAANRLTTVVRTGEEMIITSGGDKGGSFVTRAWRWR